MLIQNGIFQWLCITTIILILENLNLIYKKLNYLAFTFRGFFTFSGLVEEEVSTSDIF